MFKRSNVVTTILILASLAFSAAAADRTPRKVKKKQTIMKLIGKPSGPAQEVIDAARDRIEQSEVFQKELSGKKYRFFTVEFTENASMTPTGIRAVYYDYSDDVTVLAETDLSGSRPVSITRSYYQPNPTDDELAEASKVIEGDPAFTNSLKSGGLKVFRPMPPVTVLNGTTERLVNVGLKPTTSDKTEIVSVSLLRAVVVRYPEAAPTRAASTPDACGMTDANQPRTPIGTAGTFDFTVQDGSGNVLWQMNITRPSVSGGTNGSGIELRNVRYKGKSVFKRAHVPLLDVQYEGNACGPFRDWLFDEGAFQAPDAGAQDFDNGFRILASGQIATTALETGNDVGNYRGVAIYTQGNEAVLVTEMEAGWYRYIMEWRFDMNGTIRPRFAFGGVQNNCVCVAHHHHAYWRFDFDVVTTNNRVYQMENGRKFLLPILTEMNGNKKIQTNRRLLIQNGSGNEAYMLVPNIFDGTVDAFGVNDFWVLRYKNVSGGSNVQNEIDDGTFAGDPNAINKITPFVNGESVANQDVVIWYGAHFLHNDGANVINSQRSPKILSGDHVVGPDLRPVRW